MTTRTVWVSLETQTQVCGQRFFLTFPGHDLDDFHPRQLLNAKHGQYNLPAFQF